VEKTKQLWKRLGNQDYKGLGTSTSDEAKEYLGDLNKQTHREISRDLNQWRKKIIDW